MKEEKLIWHPFLDWNDIWPGYAGAYDNCEGYLMEPPVGVRLTVQPARKSRVFFRMENTWENKSMYILTMMYEDGVYRMWYSGTSSQKESYLCYAESKDGFNWKRPELGLYNYQGSTANNIICDSKEFDLQSVFIDPTALPEKRYKGIGATARYFRKGISASEIDAQKYRELRKEMELKGYTREQIEKELEVHNMVVGGVSADGLRWSKLEKPLIDVGGTALDTHNLGVFDPEAGEYAAYLRGHLVVRRSVRRTGGKEFGNWSSTRFVFSCDPQDPVSDDVYNPCYCRHPTGKFHLMFPSMYHRLDSELDIQLATSRDGWNWTRPERKPIITQETAEGKYSCIYASPNMVPLNGDWETGNEWGLPYVGYFGRHDWSGPYAAEDTPDGEFRWAIWKRDRLVALEAPTEGRVTIIPQVCHGKELRLNFQTGKAGWVKVELVTPNLFAPPAPDKVKPIEGYEVAKADILMGDELSKAVTWQGRSDLSGLEGRKVSLRFYMARAKIFSFSI